MSEPGGAAPQAADRRRMYELMVLIRACDDRVRRGLSGGEFACTYWPATGQEAIAAALGTVLRIDDQLVTTYRGLHDQIAKGVPIGPLVAEILTRGTGVNGGKGGSMHISHPPSGTVLSTGIVGSGLPIAVGVGLAAQLGGDDQIAVASFGDGATGTGSFHEAVNLAALWRLPVVFVCQNNHYAEMTPTAHAQPVADVADRAAAYGIPGVTGGRERPRRGVPGPRRRPSGGPGPATARPSSNAPTYRLWGHYFGDAMRTSPRASWTRPDGPSRSGGTGPGCWPTGCWTRRRPPPSKPGRANRWRRRSRPPWPPPARGRRGLRRRLRTDAGRECPDERRSPPVSGARPAT